MDNRIKVIAEQVDLANNAVLVEARERSLSFKASEFAVYGPNGIAKKLPTGTKLYRKGDLFIAYTFAPVEAAVAAIVVLDRRGVDAVKLWNGNVSPLFADGVVVEVAL